MKNRKVLTTGHLRHEPPPFVPLVLKPSLCRLLHGRPGLDCGDISLFLFFFFFFIAIISKITSVIKITRLTKLQLLQGALGRSLYTLHLSHLSPTLARFLSLFALNYENLSRFGKPNCIFPQLLFDLATGLGNSACLEFVCPSPSPTPCRSPCAPCTCRWTYRHQPPLAFSAIIPLNIITPFSK